MTKEKEIGGISCNSKTINLAVNFGKKGRPSEE